PDLAIQHCRILIERIRQLFPRLQSIGWLALPPRWKPSKLFNDLEINENNRKFNQHLQILSKEMNFEIIDAGLQQHHMHRDGLHPSIQSGRLLIEKISNQWFAKQNKRLSITDLNTRSAIRSNNNIPIAPKYVNNNNNNKIIHPKQIKEKINQQPSIQHKSNHCKTFTRQSKHITNHAIQQHQENNNYQMNKQNIYQTSTETSNYIPKTEKGRVYTVAAANKKQTLKQVEQMEIISEENQSLSIARPSPTGLAGPPAPLYLSDFSEIFDEWLPEPTPGQKRKLGHRRDDPPTPPSPRQPPPIIPRKTLPPRNPNIPLVGGSLHASPISKNNHE
ncbi:unnamed protein product, partial [Rotaria sordida]